LDEAVAIADSRLNIALRRGRTRRMMFRAPPQVRVEPTQERHVLSPEETAGGFLEKDVLPRFAG